MSVLNSKFRESRRLRSNVVGMYLPRPAALSLRVGPGHNLRTNKRAQEQSWALKSQPPLSVSGLRGRLLRGERRRRPPPNRAVAQKTRAIDL